MIDSSAVEDRCGVCHGNGSTCTTVRRTFEETEGLGMFLNHFSLTVHLFLRRYFDKTSLHFPFGKSLKLSKVAFLL